MGKEKTSRPHGDKKNKSMQKWAIDSMFKKNRNVQGFQRIYTIEVRPYSEPNFDNPR